MERDFPLPHRPMPHASLLPRSTATIVDLLAEVAPPLLDARLPPRHCVPGTRVGLDVLAHFGVNAKPCPTRLAAGNALGIKLLPSLRRGGHFSPHGKRIPRLIHCGIPLPGHVTIADGEYDGHLVIVAENRTLLDLTSGAFSQAGATVPSALVSSVTDAFLAGAAPHTVQASATGVVRYEAVPSDISYGRFHSWQGLEVTRQLTKDIIRTMTPLLEPASAENAGALRCA